MTKSPFVIGIGGRSCSGKSTAVKFIEQKYEDVFRISQDRYFKKNAKSWERPDALMNDRLIRSIKKLKNNETTHIPSKGWTEMFDVLVNPHKIIVVEGFLIFENKELAKLCDLKIWVDVDDTTILYRRTKRDGTSKNMDYTMKEVIPISKEYERVQQKRADLILDGNADNKTIKKTLETYVVKHLKLDKVPKFTSEDYISEDNYVYKHVSRKEFNGWVIDIYNNILKNNRPSNLAGKEFFYKGDNYRYLIIFGPVIGTEKNYSNENDFAYVNFYKRKRGIAPLKYKPHVKNPHLARFEDGGTFFLKQSQFESFLKGKSKWGREDGQFIIPTADVEKINEKFYRILEKELGFSKGYFTNGDNLVRVDVTNLDKLNIRLPKGNQSGANKLFVEGGFTVDEKGNKHLPEAVIDSFNPKNATVKGFFTMLMPAAGEWIKILDIPDWIVRAINKIEHKPRHDKKYFFKGDHFIYRVEYDSKGLRAVYKRLRHKWTSHLKN